MPTDIAKDAQFVSAKRFTYGGREVEMGEYINPAGFRNDRLIFSGDNRWVTPVADMLVRGDWPCDRCGRHFAFEPALRAHQARTYAIEHVDPEHAASLKEDAAKRVGRKLRNESLAELAEDQGYAVKDVRDGPGGKVPTIAPYG